MEFRRFVVVWAALSIMVCAIAYCEAHSIPKNVPYVVIKESQ